MFTALESKGILRGGPEEFLLSSRYRPNDELAAEFIRTFRTHLFHGSYYLKRYDALKEKEEVVTVQLPVPKAGAPLGTTDEVSLYGFRGKDPRVMHLSPWEFVQWWKPHRLRAPSVDYKLTKWRQKPSEIDTQ